MNDSPTLTETLRAIFDAELAAVRVCLPGVIESVSDDGTRANVKPLTQDIYTDDAGTESRSLPVIQNVPIQWVRAGHAALTFPLAKGHFVTLSFTDKDISKWLRGSTDPTPDNSRSHHLSDAIAIPGVYPFGQKFAAYHKANIVLGFDNGKQVHVKPTEIALGSEEPSDFAPLASKVDGALADIKSHTHPVVGPLASASDDLLTLETDTGSATVRIDE